MNKTSGKKGFMAQIINYRNCLLKSSTFCLIWFKSEFTLSATSVPLPFHSSVIALDTFAAEAPTTDPTPPVVFLSRPTFSR